MKDHRGRAAVMGLGLATASRFSPHGAVVYHRGRSQSRKTCPRCLTLDPREPGRQTPLTTLPVIDLPIQPRRRDVNWEPSHATWDVTSRSPMTIAISVAIVAFTIAIPNPWADEVVSFDAGLGGADGYDQPAVTLGPPELMTGEDTGTTSVVSPFSPPWRPDEVVSIGAGGSIVLSFDEPVLNAPDNLFGIDLIIFGNAGLVDVLWPSGVCGGLFGADGGSVSVSTDGTQWHVAEDTQANGLWPTMAYVDASPYAESAGEYPADPTRAIDPTLTLTGVNGLDYASLVKLYDQSAGGVGIDLAPLGLDFIRYIRIDVPMDALISSELDAVVDAGVWINPDPTGDGLVNVDDLLLIIGSWGNAGGSADLNHDGIVSVDDLLIVLKAWT